MKQGFPGNQNKKEAKLVAVRSIPKSTQAFLKSLFYSTMTKTYQDSIPSHASILVNFLVPKSIAGETLSPPAGGCHGVDEGQKKQTAGDVT